MTIEEWEAVCTTMETCFRGELPDEKRLTYFRFVSGASYRDMDRAIENLVESGQVFMPTPAELRAAMEPPAPPFDVVWHQIRVVLRDADMYGERQSVEYVRALCGDVIAGWVQSYGALRLATEPVHDPQHGGLVMRRIAESYREATRTCAARRHLSEAKPLAKRETLQLPDRAA